MVGQIKHIVVIESLGENDRKTGKELYDDAGNPIGNASMQDR